MIWIQDKTFSGAEVNFDAETAMALLAKAVTGLTPPGYALPPHSRLAVLHAPKTWGLRRQATFCRRIRGSQLVLLRRSPWSCPATRAR